jgi:DNA-binding transcriptional LysR family regulator
VNVRDFLDVKVICETGSLRKAAVVLGVTQPTLSNRIAHLEDQLGATLFDRSRGKSQPTELAQFIARRAGTLSDEAARLTREVKRLAAGKGGLVRIGIGTIPSRVLLAGIVANVNNQYPDLSLEVMSAQTDKLAEWLANREVDILVCPPLEPAPRSVVSELLLKADIIAVVRPDHPMLEDPPTTIIDLFKYPFATTFLEPRYRNILHRNYGIDLENMVGRVVCSDQEMLIRVVTRSSQLFTAGPRFSFAAEIASGKLAVVELAVPFKHLIYMHVNNDAYPLPAVAKVQGILRETFAALRQTQA